MLETTLSTVFVPSTNLKGNVTGANWSFLLPSLELDQVVCLGAPSSAARANLARISCTLTIVTAQQAERSEAEGASQTQDHAQTILLGSNADARLPLQDGCADLIFITSHGMQWLAERASLKSEVQRLLKPTGLVYFDLGVINNQRKTNKEVDALLQSFGNTQRFWLTPLAGEMHTAVPLHDRQMINFFLKHALYSPALKVRFFKGIERSINKRLLFNPLARRYSTLASNGGEVTGEQPPRYLREIAADAGVDISTHRWGLAARGEYSSRKVLFFLFNRISGESEYIVKMTRDPIFNARLENESRALTLLQERGIGDLETLPRTVFFGHHSDLAIVGETAIVGSSFEGKTARTADCPYARAAVDWLVHLGAATADRTSVKPLNVAEGLESLFQRFEQIYQLTPAHRDFLAQQLETLRQSRAAFPLVFQHGDPGTWNIMVGPSGRVAFLDWEAAEPQGLPLWDIFYFLRTYGVWTSRAAGVRDTVKSFSQHFLFPSPFNSLLTETTERYCEQVGLARELVEPLFYTCWMHRALKEATRLSADRLQNGHYVRLLRLCMDQRRGPALQKLFYETV